MAGGGSGLADLRGPRLLNTPQLNTSHQNTSHKATGPDLRAALEREAAVLGFDALGITDPAAIGSAGDKLQQFLQSGAHGDMAWLADPRRTHPRLLWQDVRSIIMLGVNYGPDENPLAVLAERSHGAISVYARGDDYHDLIKKRLKALARWLLAQEGGDVKVFVDTAAVMEKPLAHQAGLGWQGKHTNLVSKDYGSWLFLGAIFTTLELPRDAAKADHCGSCRACLDSCPTAAFPAPYRLDARRCVSYLTIEHKGAIPHEFRRAIGNRIYGCDDCLAACPWNKFAEVGREIKLAARDELRAPSLRDLVRLDDAAFRAKFTKSPVKRIGRDRFVRNVLIAIGNSSNPSLAHEAERLLGDDSAMVRGAAVWALAQLLPADEFARLAASAHDLDESVQREWAQALASNPDQAVAL